jgi:hypothetical protein
LTSSRVIDAPFVAQHASRRVWRTIRDAFLDGTRAAYDPLSRGIVVGVNESRRVRRRYTRRMRRAALTCLALLAACDRGESRPPPATKPAPPKGEVTTPPPIDPTAKHRHLTAAEIAMVRPLFRASVDYSTILVIDDRFTPAQPENTYMTPEGSIYAPGHLYREDYAAPSVEPALQAVFVHEIGHVWQFQNGMDMISEGLLAFASAEGDYEKAYPYTLARDRDLLDYGMEQAASIFEDYFLIRTHELPPRRLQNHALSPSHRDALYAAVLARFLADPTYVRGTSAAELLERHRAAAAAAPPTPIDAPHCAETDAEHEAQHLCGWRFEEREP